MTSLTHGYHRLRETTLRIESIRVCVSPRPRPFSRASADPEVLSRSLVHRFVSINSPCACPFCSIFLGPLTRFFLRISFGTKLVMLACQLPLRFPWTLLNCSAFAKTHVFGTKLCEMDDKTGIPSCAWTRISHRDCIDSNVCRLQTRVQVDLLHCSGEHVHTVRIMDVVLELLSCDVQSEVPSPVVALFYVGGSCIVAVTSTRH